MAIVPNGVETLPKISIAWVDSQTDARGQLKCLMSPARRQSAAHALKTNISGQKTESTPSSLAPVGFIGPWCLLIPRWKCSEGSTARFFNLDYRPVVSTWLCGSAGRCGAVRVRAGGRYIVDWWNSQSRSVPSAERTGSIVAIRQSDTVSVVSWT